MGPWLGERSLISAISPKPPRNALAKERTGGASAMRRRTSAAGRCRFASANSLRTSTRIWSRMDSVVFMLVALEHCAPSPAQRQRFSEARCLIFELLAEHAVQHARWRDVLGRSTLRQVVECA